MTLAPRVLVVLPQKTGTHLVLELMVALGYKAFGAIRPSPANLPRFDAAQRREIAALVFSAEEYQQLLREEGTEEFIRRTDEAWSALAWSWQRRLGQPVANRYGQEKHDSVDLVASNPRFSSTRFADTPSGMCWLWHELDVTKVDGGFIGEWSETGEPPIILNYRDPRDALVSLINFVDGRTAQGFGNFYERRVYNAILRQKPTMHEKIDYALRDRYFLAREEFEKALWLLHHPWICKVSYEELVGPEGGGSQQRQRAAVRRILRHLGCDRDPDDIAEQLYNPGSWSFHKGRTGAWKDAFSSANLRELYRQYGDIIEQFGYE
jgi:hypothetical protein